jgi:hypothetical protein
MVVAPNQKKLIIPGKADPSAPLYYARDMRTIEEWANAQASGGITEITTGTPGVLTITNATGPVVNIDSTGGGGGGGTAGMGDLDAGSDTADYPFTTIHLGPNDDNSPRGQQGSEIYLFDNATGFDQFYSFAKSWFTFVGAGLSINYLPIVGVPVFTGPDLGIALVMSAQSIDATNMDVEATEGALTQSSGAIVRYPASDYTNVNTFGSDILFTQGTGTSSGSGQISQGGGSPGSLGGLYLCSVQLNITVQDGVSFS